MQIGVGYRRELASWLASRPRGITAVELTAEHFYGAPKQLAALIRSCTLLGNPMSRFVHGLGLSLGTPGPLDRQRVKQFCEVAEACQAQWISEHVAFTRSAETDLGHLNPVPPTRDSLKIMAEHALELASCCGRPLLLENITSHVRLRGEMSETDYLNELCCRAGCGLLLDVTNLFVNSRNHGFDPVQWLYELEPEFIVQLHIVGYSRRGKRYIDDHAKAVPPELLELAQAVIQYAPVKAIILERDADFPETSAMEEEIAKLESLCAGN